MDLFSTLDIVLVFAVKLDDLKVPPVCHQPHLKEVNGTGTQM